ncbi:MAG: hypothetical protein AAB414_02715 [Patescibacteria group bacterium]
MSKLIGLILFLILYFWGFGSAQALENSFVTVVNPIRGEDFWQEQGQKIATAVSGQLTILKEFDLPATWLIRFDALKVDEVTSILKSLPDHEKGLFLEVTPSWAEAAGVKYHKSSNWHAAGSAFLSGYEREERLKLIDSAFEKFREVFNFYPKSVGAWWIDSFSLEYIQKKYGITASLEVSDQYTTDDYQIWGQFWSTPYYPAKNNVLHPAKSQENKLPLVMMQWAPRDPVNGYGNGVFESTFSVQSNDYLDYHKLNTGYFRSLVDIYTKGQFGSFSHLSVGLENSYSFEKYGFEYRKQIEVLVDKQRLGQLRIVTMKDFASWYSQSFPDLSPQHLIIADDPLSTGKKAIWFMNPYYRAGLFISSDGSIFRDIRQYVGEEEEFCYLKACSEVNFATFATRVLDNVTYGHKWVIDEGKISRLKVVKENNSYVVSYINEGSNERRIEFLPRDISIDGKSRSIDSVIIEATEKNIQHIRDLRPKVEADFFKWSVEGTVSKIFRFLVFLLLTIIMPGIVFTNRILERSSPTFLRLFVSLVSGIVIFSWVFYILGFLKLQSFSLIYILICAILFIRLRSYNLFKLKILKSQDWFYIASFLIIVGGTVFQIIPTFRSGLYYGYGMGFWGPNTHDGVWHIALVNQISKSIPPQNPIFAGMPLENYHYFYDLLIAATHFISKIPVEDLLFRFYPILFSIGVGIGTYYLVWRLFKDRIGVLKTKVTAIFTLFFVYFAGSFGWIVEFMKGRGLGGESAFWVNQAISFNLNPPFAISLIIIITLFHVLLSLYKSKAKSLIVLAIVLAGSLISFKAYGAVLVLGSLLVVAFFEIFKRSDLRYLIIFIVSSAISAWLFLSNFQVLNAVMIFAPFWFIHSMIDSPDRVGWVRLSIARTTASALGQWLKFFLADTLGLLIFIAGNLGFRVFGLLSLFKLRSIVSDTPLFFILIFSFLSGLIPILFIQSGNPWNTIQFFYYLLYTSSIFSGLVITHFIFRLPKTLVPILVAIVFILTPINSLATASSYFHTLPHAYISSKEIEALKFLSNQDEGVVLTYPYDKRLREIFPEPFNLFIYDSTAYVSALSKKGVFVEDEPQNQILLTDYKKRIVASENFFEILDFRKFNFLEKNNIRYIYLLKIFNIGAIEQVKALEKEKLVKNIFENEEVVIYKVVEQ